MEFEEIWSEAQAINDWMHWNRVPGLLENEVSNETLLEFLRTRSQISDVSPYEHKAIFELLGEMAQFNPRFRPHIAVILTDFQYHANVKLFVSRLAAANAVKNGFAHSNGPYLISLSELVGKALVVEPHKAIRLALFTAYKTLVNATIQAEMVRLRRSI